MFDLFPSLFELFFVEPGEGDLPGPPVAHVYVNPWVGHRHEYSGTRDLLTAESVCEQEWEKQVDRLKKKLLKDLEETRKQGREKFRRKREI